MKVTDQIGREIHLKSTPKRIVCLVPSLTELLFDLGLGDSVNGVTKFCVHPLEAKKTKTIVGGTKHVKFQKIKDLKPDIILCNKEENTEIIVEECSKISPTHVSDIFTIQDTLGIINVYGIIFGCQTKANVIKEEIRLEYQSFLHFISEKPIIKAAYFIWRNPWMVAGNNTFINHLLELNKFENVFSNQDRYPEIELEELYKVNKAVLILLSSEPYPFEEKHELEIKEVLTNSKVICVNGEMFSWYGSRLIKAFDYFKRLRERV